MSLTRGSGVDVEFFNTGTDCMSRSTVSNSYKPSELRFVSGGGFSTACDMPVTELRGKRLSRFLAGEEPRRGATTPGGEGFGGWVQPAFPRVKVNRGFKPLQAWLPQ